MKRALRNRWVFLAGAALLAIILVISLQGGSAAKATTLSQLQGDINHRTVSSAVIHDSSHEVTGTLLDGTAFKTAYPAGLDQSLTNSLLASGAKVSVDHGGSDFWGVVFETYGPILLLAGLFIYAILTLQGGGSRVAAFGKAKARTVGKEQPKVTFADVAGADEAVAELQEIKEFLESPARFQALGAKIPKGVLLFGPPGTGKTLLARAVAGEAGVPFFSISGSDFVEMFVGVGASRVRDLFEQAKSNAPSIVFMDEIDAVGRHRGAGLGGGHDEREQTLNQLLVEMDGFDVRGGVILIAATNRPDILDPALLRPGRFDRQIVVDRPDLTGRRKILEVHARGKPMASSANLDVLAKRTPGFTGADLANLLNEAAILTARRNLGQIGMRECEEAIDRVLAGPERKTLVMSEHDKLVTAYHEAGHAIVGHVLPHADPIHKVSIVARSRSLGLTFTLPEDRFNHSRSQLRDVMAMCLGGRSAEEIVFAEPTTGAENDIEKVTRIARAMVTEYGMSDELGPQQLGQRDGEVFLGRDINHQANYSNEVAAIIDGEIRRLIDEAHRRARAVLVRHRAVLERMARELVERETLDSMDLEAILGPISAARAATPSPLSRRPAGSSRSQPAGAEGGNGTGKGRARPAAGGSPAPKQRPLAAAVQPRKVTTGAAPAGVGDASRRKLPSAPAGVGDASRRKPPSASTGSKPVRAQPAGSAGAVGSKKGRDPQVATASKAGPVPRRGRPAAAAIRPGAAKATEP